MSPELEAEGKDLLNLHRQLLRRYADLKSDPGSTTEVRSYEIAKLRYTARFAKWDAKRVQEKIVSAASSRKDDVIQEERSFRPSTSIARRRSKANNATDDDKKALLDDMRIWRSMLECYLSSWAGEQILGQENLLYKEQIHDDKENIKFWHRLNWQTLKIQFTPEAILKIDSDEQRFLYLLEVVLATWRAILAKGSKELDRQSMDSDSPDTSFEHRLQARRKAQHRRKLEEEQIRLHEEVVKLAGSYSKALLGEQTKSISLTEVARESSKLTQKNGDMYITPKKSDSSEDYKSWKQALRKTILHCTTLQACKRLIDRPQGSFPNLETFLRDSIRKDPYKVALDDFNEFVGLPLPSITESLTATELISYISREIFNSFSSFNENCKRLMNDCQEKLKCLGADSADEASRIPHLQFMNFLSIKLKIAEEEMLMLDGIVDPLTTLFSSTPFQKILSLIPTAPPLTIASKNSCWGVPGGLRAEVKRNQSRNPPRTFLLKRSREEEELKETIKRPRVDSSKKRSEPIPLLPLLVCLCGTMAVLLVTVVKAEKDKVRAARSGSKKRKEVSSDEPAGQ